MIMQVYGYKKDSDEFVELQEASIECKIKELDSIIEFLQNTREEHKKAMGKTKICHSHY